MIKRISWKTYLSTFYNGLKIKTQNTERGSAHTIDAVIFYKIDGSILEISFAYENWCIFTNTDIPSLQKEYDLLISKSISSQQMPDFFEWLNETYMDGRGVKEV